MTSRNPLSRVRERWLGSGGAVLGIAGIFFVWIALISVLHLAERTALRNARNDTENLARAFEAQITRDIKAVDQSLMFVRDSFARDPDGFDVATWARSASAVTDNAIQLSITDRNGIMTANSVAGGGSQVDLSDREHIRVHMKTDRDDLFISKPVIGRVSHRWSIQFTRKLFDAKGKFAGVAVVSLDPIYLTRLYASIDLGKTGAVMLLGTDGVVRATARQSTPDNPEFIGKQVRITANDINDKVIKARIGPTDLDGIRRVTSFQKLSSYPLVVAVGLGSQEVLANTVLMRQLGYAVAIVLSVFLVVVVCAMLVYQHRHAIARERLKISERLYAEKSLILETALEHMNQGIVMVDADHKMQVCNHRASDLLELPEELTRKGTPFSEVIKFQCEGEEFGPKGSEPDYSEKFALSYDIFKGPKVYERKRPTGTTLEICSMPTKDGGVVRTYTDISARIEFEENLRTARDQANSAAKAKSEFLATMSHEIRSPLSGLVGALDLLRATALEADQAHMAELAHGSARNLLAILNDILDFSKIEAGALTLSLEPVNLQTLIEQLAEPHRLVARGRSVALNVSIAPDLPHYIRSDRLRLGQIITNLLSNAVKFTSSGTIDLSARLEQVRGASTLRIDVRDTGLGMSEKTLTRLFQPFTQADGSSSRMVEGTGLGLCISRKLAGLLDGTLDVVSELGIGSCFSLCIPCIAHEIVLAPEPSVSTLDLEATLTGRRILVVDDNPTNQWLTRRQLTLLGAETETVSNGEAALEALARSSFDAVVTDCHMPGFDGVALARAIRNSDGPERDRPIIGLTADVTQEQANRCREAGMDMVLYKPVTQARLAQVLCKHTSQPVAPTPSHAPVFDSTMCQDLFEPGDAEAETWLRDYAERADAQCAELEGLVHTDPLDRPTIAAAAHQLVGASLSVGVTRFAHAVRSLEQAAPTAPKSTLLELMTHLQQEHRAAFAAIEAFLAKNEEPALL